MIEVIVGALANCATSTLGSDGGENVRLLMALLARSAIAPPLSSKGEATVTPLVSISDVDVWIV